MDIEVKIDPSYTTPKMTLYTSELTPDSIYCFFTESQHVLA